MTSLLYLPKTSSSELVLLAERGSMTNKQLLARGVGRAFDIVMKRGKGSWIWTHDDRKLLDFTSGVCVTNLGHSHPRVVRAAQQQIETLAHGMVRTHLQGEDVAPRSRFTDNVSCMMQMNVAYHEPILELAERLVPVMPKGLNSFVFATSYVIALLSSRRATTKRAVCE